MAITYRVLVPNASQKPLRIHVATPDRPFLYFHCSGKRGPPLLCLTHTDRALGQSVMAGVVGGDCAGGEDLWGAGPDPDGTS